MESEKHYVFKSERLGFRAWMGTDLEKLAEINADPEVMKFFPAIQSTIQTKAFMERMSLQFKEKGFCYFAVDILKTYDFIGLSVQTFEADF